MPTPKNLISLAVFILSWILAPIFLFNAGHEFGASAKGSLKENYREVTSKKSSYSTTTYEVEYTFMANGKKFEDSDTLYEKPDKKECTVYYDPKHPERHSLTNSDVNLNFTVLGLSMYLVTLVAYATLPINPKSPATNGAIGIGGGIGDAEGEYLTGQGGKYAAVIYVGLAFWGQLFITSGILSIILLVASGGKIHLSILSAMSGGLAAAITLLIYWDRWKCITVYASKYCTGCVNISLLIVPPIAFCYANWRGILKLMRR